MTSFDLDFIPEAPRHKASTSRPFAKGLTDQAHRIALAAITLCNVFGALIAVTGIVPDVGSDEWHQTDEQKV